jgi:triosephosphate isomerase
MRQKIIAGNWKMNASKQKTEKLVKEMLAGLPKADAKIILCVPFPYLNQVQSLIVNSKLYLGAQNVNTNTEGAFTGEVSAKMIKDFSAEYVIVGHSERRMLYGEKDKTVAKKVQVAIDNKLTPIFCIGESLEEKNAGKTKDIVGRQINAVIEFLGINAFRDIIVAYEPVWAIGTGVTATPKEAQETHAFIRGLLAKHNADIAEKTQILYGGSMNPANAKSLLDCADIDGGLIGGASLKAKDFLQICASV